MLSKFMPWMKFVQPVLILILIASLAFMSGQVSKARDARDALKVDKAEIARSLGVADKQTVILGSIAALKLTVVNQRDALKTISDAVIAAQSRSVAADAALAKAQKSNAAEYARTRPVVDALDKRKATGDTTKDRLVIAEDSKAAWQGWAK